MQKSECGFGGGFKRVPVGAHGFKQAKCADDIGLASLSWLKFTHAWLLLYSLGHIEHHPGELLADL